MQKVSLEQAQTYQLILQGFPDVLNIEDMIRPVYITAAFQEFLGKTASTVSGFIIFAIHVLRISQRMGHALKTSMTGLDTATSRLLLSSICTWNSEPKCLQLSP